MNRRALLQVMLILGILVSVAGMIAIRRVHSEETSTEVALIGLLAAGAFLFIAGAIGVLVTPSAPDEYDETAPREPVEEAKPSAVSTAIGVYVFAISVIAGLVVGFIQGDAGAGIATFTFGAILGAAVFGLGYVLGHRPVEDEA